MSYVDTLHPACGGAGGPSQLPGCASRLNDRCDLDAELKGKFAVVLCDSAIISLTCMVAFNR